MRWYYNAVNFLENPHPIAHRSLQWRHNERDSVSNHPVVCNLLLKPFVQTQINENTKAPRHWPFLGSSVDSPHKGPVTRKMFPFDDVIMVVRTNSDLDNAWVTRVTLYTAGHLHTAVPHCEHSRAPIVNTAVRRENNEHGCVYLRCRAVCKPGCVEGHPWVTTVLYELPHITGPLHNDTRLI